ncbi:MAG: TIGR04076 family protein [Dehalococcoidia bacterium]
MAEAERFDVLAKVVSQTGHCGAGHEVGQEFVIGHLTPAGVCCSAFGAVMPSARVLRFGGTFPWAKDPDTTTVSCPDAANPVVFDLKRIRS